MASLSAKQLGMAWINEKLEPSRINPETEELNFLNGGPIKQKLLEDTKAFIFDELAKVKVRYNNYAQKYVGKNDDSSTDSGEDGEQQEEQ